ncbi:MAG: Coenzyme F420 hydrogenase/dehydrogenase, beta subunit C-terminal domain [Archaeoglobaceae archaeon]|nr:Coenzyme F420 hydrogenase/dehydrogenase, beta subunit C-terminal domain [Archaeoglobaceae archaeon]HDD36347.1 4Fe-4S dicluster domain-containing protein [Archaeoglobus veneficus]
MMYQWEIKIPKKIHDTKFFGNLKIEVIDKGICSHCGTCATICPVNGIKVEDKPIYFPNWEKECIDCGACIKVCPRWDYKPLNGIGDYLEILAAKSKRFKGQDGAMVTEIMASAFEMDLIDRAIFVGRDENWKPITSIVKDIEQLFEETIRGTKYSFADVMPRIKEVVKDYRVGVIGTPCMMSGVRKLQQESGIFNNIKLAIGLFCTENFYHWQLHEFLLKEKNVEMKDAVKTDIKRGKFIVSLKNGSKVSFPVKEFDPIIPSGCEVCQDFAAIESDVSVGSVGSKAGYSSVIVRRENAKKVLDYIFEKEYAERGEVNIDAIQKLCEFKIKIHPYPPKH